MRYWLLGIGIVLLGGVVVVTWYVNSMAQTFRMRNMVYQQVSSPDGRYVATLAYSDGPTYGYYFVCLQPSAGWRPLQSDDPIPPDEVAEVAAEGLGPIHWQGGHALVVGYAKSGVEQAQFVLQKRSWRDVRIVYRRS